MQISLGARGDYAVRAGLALARAFGDGRRKSKDIASSMDIPQKYLPQVLGLLIRGGLVESVAGPGGGYSLTRSPSDISLLDVIEAAEGPIRSTTCVLRGGPCHWEDACAVHTSWAEAQDALAQRLRETSLQRLAEDDAALEERRTATA